MLTLNDDISFPDDENIEIIGFPVIWTLTIFYLSLTTAIGPPHFAAAITILSKLISGSLCHSIE